MDRKAFVKLAAASPALASPIYVGGSDGNLDGDAGGTVIGAPSLDSQTAFTFYSPLAEQWYRAGQYFEWNSTTRNNEGRRVNVFYRTFGSRSNPALVILHGGSGRASFDYREIISRLEDDYFIVALDFPGNGFSDKPQDGYSYMVEDDAKLVDHFVREVVGLSQFHVLTHSRGSGVGLAFLGNYLDDEASPYEITYHFISNTNMFLPLANNSQGQYDLLDPELGPELIRQRRAAPRVTEGTPEQVANADIQAFNDGIGARLYLATHLLERAEKDLDWLDNLRRSPIPTALIWGLPDTVSPIRIPNHVWSEYLDKRAVEGSYWILPTVTHSPHEEVPDDLETIIRTCLEEGIPDPEDENAYMWELARNRNRSATAPFYVGRSIIRNVHYPSAIEYTPDGYIYPGGFY